MDGYGILRNGKRGKPSTKNQQLMGSPWHDHQQDDTDDDHGGGDAAAAADDDDNV